MAALFIAKHRLGVTDYISCRSGIDYKITPERDGFGVVSKGANLTFWTAQRRDAIRLIETTDLASLANREGKCSQSTA